MTVKMTNYTSSNNCLCLDFLKLARRIIHRSSTTLVHTAAAAIDLRFGEKKKRERIGFERERETCEGVREKEKWNGMG
jgi:hypothetical protein